MAYTPTSWQNGDIITAEKMNKIESGLANSGELYMLETTATYDEENDSFSFTSVELRDSGVPIVLAISSNEEGSETDYNILYQASEEMYVYGGGTPLTVNRSTGEVSEVQETIHHTGDLEPAPSEHTQINN